jgi:hypothetical protein
MGVTVIDGSLLLMFAPEFVLTTPVDELVGCCIASATTSCSGTC